MTLARRFLKDITNRCGYVYIVAGYKGHPALVKQQGRKGRRRRLKSAHGRGALATEKPSVFGLIQRGGDMVIQMLENVQQKTIQPIIDRKVAKGSTFYTDEYAIYDRLTQWGYDHHTVNHNQSEYAHDEDDDGLWKVAGRFYVPGFARIAVFRRNSCHFIWFSLSLPTMSGVAEKPSFTLYSRCF